MKQYKIYKRAGKKIEKRRFKEYRFIATSKSACKSALQSRDDDTAYITGKDDEVKNGEKSVILVEK